MIKKEIEVKLTPQELANEIWEEFDDEEQCEFFNELGNIFKRKLDYGLRQINYIIMNGSLNNNAKWLIKELYEGIIEKENK